MTNGNAQVNRTVKNVIVTVFLMLITAMVLVPFIWMIFMSFRTTGAILENPYGFPETFRIQNYTQLLFSPRIHFYTYFLNSVVVTLGAMLITLVLSTMGGYGFGRRRYNFRFRALLFSILLFALMLPRQAMYIPQFVMMTRYNLLNTRLSLILLYAAYGISVSTFLLKTYFSQLPEEMEESARMDGAGDFLIFYKIMLPLARPVLSTVILLNLREFWNELLIALTMVTKPALRTLPLAMMHFVGENAANYAMAAASLVVGMLPLLILYLILAERFVEGITAGAIKG
ncbi:MAG: carbohydrate ABC transporter permease [Spirochaetota bacterium]|nr:carbohydrate ABC transporter permease [Spirochaetota bacterium]